MRILIVLFTLIGMAFAGNCDVSTWSVPTVSEGNCFQNGQYPSTDNWFCDWGMNSGFYYNYLRCHGFASSPAYYSSYISSMPSAMYNMMAHTTAVMNQCVDYTENLEASSWGDIPYMCPDPQSSYRHTIGYGGGTISSFYDSSCQNIQRIFCEAVWPPYSWQSSSQLSSSYDMMTLFLTYYGHNSGRLYNAPTGQYPNDLTSSFLDQFVSSLYRCQSAIWENFVKIDCSVVTSMLNALGYPQNNWMPSISTYEAYSRDGSSDICRTIVDHVYSGYLETIHKSVEYVSYVTTCAPSYIPHGGSEDDDDNNDDDGLSEWVIVALSAIGVVGMLGFCTLLFFLIYKIYTFSAVDSAAETRHRAVGKEEVILNIPDGKSTAKASRTPPPSHDNAKKTITEEYQSWIPSRYKPMG